MLVMSVLHPRSQPCTVSVRNLFTSVLFKFSLKNINCVYYLLYISITGNLEIWFSWISPDKWSLSCLDWQWWVNSTWLQKCPVCLQRDKPHTALNCVRSCALLFPFHYYAESGFWHLQSLLMIPSSYSAGHGYVKTKHNLFSQHWPGGGNCTVFFPSL